MSDTEQQTLTGESAVSERHRPKTLLRCVECDDYILRSNRCDHEHYVYAPPWHRSLYEYAQAEVDG